MKMYLTTILIAIFCFIAINAKEVQEKRDNHSVNVNVMVYNHKPLYSVGDYIKIKITVTCDKMCVFNNIGSRMYIIGFNIDGITPWYKESDCIFSTIITLKIKDDKKYKKYYISLIKIFDNNNIINIYKNIIFYNNINKNIILG